MRVHSTITMQYRHQMISLMLLLVAMLSGCASEKAETEAPVPPVVIDEPTEPEPISLLFACAPANTNQAMTRLAENVVQSGNIFRNISNFRFIPLQDNVISNSQIDEPSEFIDKTAVRYYHSAYCYMERDVNGCLVYAKAVDLDKGTPEATSIYNGSLNAVIPEHEQSTDEIYFEPVSIYGDVTAIPEEAWTLANALTAVVNDSHNEGNTLVWKTSTNSILRNLFQRFTNNGADLPGSAASVKQWMLDLARSADKYIDSDLSAIGANEKALLETIETVATNAAADITVTPTSYPRDINLPDGAAALRWMEVEEQDGENVVKVNKFVPQMQTTTLDDINSVSRFVYPPALYYFVNSGLWTSNSKIEFDDYKNKSTWKAAVENDPNAVETLFQNGGTIQSSTKTVAIADPLQYAVAHLTMEVKAGAASLEYGAGNENTIDISKLTLKGVIIGGQRPVDYQFKPVDNSEFNVNFVYDSQVSSSTPLTTTGDTYHTLALQSYDGENINVILEFEYSDAEGTEGFKCLNGYVYPGTRFYLVGEVKLDANAVNETDDYKKRVFTQDYTTTIQMTVQSLEKAYNVLPSLLSNSLEIGVMITPKWFSAKPSEPVVME